MRGNSAAGHDGQMKGARLLRVGSICLVLGSLLGMAGPLAAAPPEWKLELQEEIRGRGLDPDDFPFPADITEEMKTWLSHRVREGDPPSLVLGQVLDALVAKKGLHLEYESHYTATAQEAFATGRANCLAFTQLFVALTREIGLPTYFVNVEFYEKYRKQGDLVVVSGHVTAGYGVGTGRIFLEFGAVTDVDYRRARRISDINALARYYSNRGAELLSEGEEHEALEWSEKATKLEPGLPDAWVNLGVARRRTGDLDGAEAAYRKAVEADASHLPAFHNLSLLLRLRGETDAGHEILRLLDRRDNRNPFIYLDLGDTSFDAGRLEEARKFYRRALRYGRYLAAPRAARGLWVLKSGKEGKARKWLRRAQAVDPDDDRTRQLARRLTELEGSRISDRQG